MPYSMAMVYESSVGSELTSCTTVREEQDIPTLPSTSCLDSSLAARPSALAFGCSHSSHGIWINCSRALNGCQKNYGTFASHDRPHGVALEHYEASYSRSCRGACDLCSCAPRRKRVVLLPYPAF